MNLTHFTGEAGVQWPQRDGCIGTETQTNHNPEARAAGPAGQPWALKLLVAEVGHCTFPRFMVLQAPVRPPRISRSTPPAPFSSPCPRILQSLQKHLRMEIPPHSVFRFPHDPICPKVGRNPAFKCPQHLTKPHFLVLSWTQFNH